MFKKKKSRVYAFYDGHGEGSPKGSPERGDGVGVTEWKFNERILKGVITVLRGAGIECVNLTPGSDNVPLKERTLRLRAFIQDNPDKEVRLFPIHANAAPTHGWSSAQGSVFFVAKNDKKSLKMAKRMVKRFSKAVGLKTRGVKQANFKVIYDAYKLGIESALIETDFMTNEEIAKMMATLEGEAKFYTALAYVFIREEMTLFEAFKNVFKKWGSE